MKLLDYIIIIFMIALVVFGILFYFQHTKNECVSNPLVFGAKQLQDATGYETYGFVYFKTKTYTEDKIYFNTTNFYLK